MSLARLAKIAGGMKKKSKFELMLASHANNKLEFDPKSQEKELPIWNKMQKREGSILLSINPRNPFDELITLTEEGKMWQYPIDNEQGLESEKKVPFEDHVFLEDLLEDFPKNEAIVEVMQNVVLGLGNNPWITVERKKEIVLWYKEYFKKFPSLQ